MLIERAQSWVRGATSIALSSSLLVVRGVGRLLPWPVLWLVLWPVAMLRTTWELCCGKPTLADYCKLSDLHWLPASRGQRLWRLLVGRTQLNLTKLLFLWPDRLATPRWAPSRIEGGERLQRLVQGGRPTVLVTLHFGPTGILLHWLRAHGLPAAALALPGRRRLPWYRRHLARLRDGPVGLREVTSQIELGQTWEMRDHLLAGRIFLLAIDGEAGRHSCFPPVGDFRLAVSTGVFQLAALTGAQAIPCLIHSLPWFSFAIHLGEPVPAEDLLDRKRHAAACDHVLANLLPVLRHHPEECSDEFLASLRRPTPEDAPVATAVTTRMASSAQPPLRTEEA